MLVCICGHRDFNLITSHQQRTESVTAVYHKALPYTSGGYLVRLNIPLWCKIRERQTETKRERRQFKMYQNQDLGNIFTIFAIFPLVNPKVNVLILSQSQCQKPQRELFHSLWHPLTSVKTIASISQLFNLLEAFWMLTEWVFKVNLN